jgi:hypothetical protein
MERQDIFDTVATHLFKQGKRAVDREGPDGFCMYRGHGNTRCAVGALIPDEVYDVKMEGNTLSGLLMAYGDVLPPWMRDERELLRELQLVHDEPAYWAEGGVTIKKRLFQTAKWFKLSPAVLDNLAMTPVDA